MPVRAAGTAVLLSAVNPKNLLLAVAGAATIAQPGIDAGEQAIAYGIFVLVATAGVALPVAIALAMGDRSRHLLDGLKSWLGGQQRGDHGGADAGDRRQAGRRRDRRVLASPDRSAGR